MTPRAKLIINHIPLPLTSIGYASTEELVLEAARPSLPTDVLLKCQDDSYIAVTISSDDWRFTYTPYYPNSVTDLETSLTVNAALPAGYADDNGTTPVYCSVEIKKLDTAALKIALSDAKALLDTLTNSEEEALKNPSKIYAAPSGTAAKDVKFGVRFISEDLKAALKTPYDKASGKISSDTFASQLECDELTKQLRAAITTLQTTTPGVGENYTDDILAAAVKKMLDGQTDAAYAQSTQPLKPGHAYPLASACTDPVSGIPVSISWEVYGSDNSDVSQYIRLDANGATVIEAPDAPLTVVFTAQAARTDTGTSINKIGSYTATLGAPIRFSDTQPSAPLFASGGNATGEIYLNLNGVEAIKSVNTGKIGIGGRKGDAARPDIYQISEARITGGAPSANGVRLDASLSSAQLSGMQSLSDTGTMHVTGEVTVTIPKEALTLDESKGWYFPEETLTQTVEIWLCNPHLSVNTHTATDGDRTHRNISVTAKYVGNAPVQVAYTKTNTEPNGNNPKQDSNVWVWVEIPFSQSASGSDGERIYSVRNVEGFGEAGTYYIWCRAWEGATGAWLYTGSHFDVGAQETN